MTNSELVDTDLSRSNLRTAKLINAGFAGADLSLANLPGAESTDANFDAKQLN